MKPMMKTFKDYSLCNLVNLKDIKSVEGHITKGNIKKKLLVSRIPLQNHSNWSIQSVSIFEISY